MKDFRLTTSMSCSNFVLFDRDYKIRKYANEIEILEEFFYYRYEMYEKRKADMIKRLVQRLEFLNN
jgi:DNA topoisomerase II